MSRAEKIRRALDRMKPVQCAECGPNYFHLETERIMRVCRELLIVAEFYSTHENLMPEGKPRSVCVKVLYDGEPCAQFGLEKAVNELVK
jgi:hypothetical protein